ncbi:hypothetical protein ACXM0N_09885 [Peribacillus simplex]
MKCYIMRNIKVGDRFVVTTLSVNENLSLKSFIVYQYLTKSTYVMFRASKKYSRAWYLVVKVIQHIIVTVGFTEEYDYVPFKEKPKIRSYF